MTNNKSKMRCIKGFLGLESQQCFLDKIVIDLKSGDKTESKCAKALWV